MYESHYWELGSIPNTGSFDFKTHLRMSFIFDNRIQLPCELSFNFHVMSEWVHAEKEEVSQ